MNNRISIKFENGQYEQTYKIRTMDAVHSLQDCEKLVDMQMVQEVEHIFKLMHQNKSNSFSRNITPQVEDEFETII